MPSASSLPWSRLDTGKFLELRLMPKTRTQKRSVEMKTDFRGGYQAQLNGPGAKKKGEMKRTQVNKTRKTTTDNEEN